MAVSLRENRAIHGAEILAERPDGSRRRLLAYPTPLHDEHGTLLGGVNMLVDISELAAARRKAEESSCAKSRFLAVASHDLRQPFLAMQLFQGILASKVKNDDAILTDLIEKHEPTLSVIVDKLGQALEQGVELLESLLDIATMEAGLLKPAICAFPVADIVERTARDCIKLAESKGLTFRTVSCHYLIRSDAVLLKRILRNLVVNAIKYTDRGGILIGCRRRRNSLAIEVWDTGPGIAKEHLETIFEAFYQINDVARARTEGLGLGLSIVTDIAKLLGHVVTVRSTLGRGSVFAVRVPLAG